MKKFLSLLTIIILVASVGLLTGCGPEIVGTKLSESQDMSGTVLSEVPEFQVAEEELRAVTESFGRGIQRKISRRFCRKKRNRFR